MTAFIGMAFAPLRAGGVTEESPFIPSIVHGAGGWLCGVKGEGRSQTLGRLAGGRGAARAM